MAHAALHFSVGMATGMTLMAPPLLRAWRARAALARPVTRWVAGGWALALYALGPSFLRHLGLPAAFTDGWWMNVFLGHPLLNHLVRHGDNAATVLILAGFGFQYAVVLACLRRTAASGRAAAE